MKIKTLVAVAGLAVAAQADTVYLKSGSMLKGTAGLIQDGKLMFKSDDLGDLKIDVANIKSMDPVRDHVLQYNDDSRETVKLDVKDGKFVVADRPVDVSRLKKTDPGVETWHGSVNGAFTAARGNTYENSWSIFGDVSKRWENDRFLADAGYYYSETGTFDGDDKKKTTDRWELHAQHDHFWISKLYGFEMGRVERDMLKGLKARYELGIGPGYQWLDKTSFETTGKWSFNQQLSVKWVKEDRENSENVKENGYAALSYEHHLVYLPKWNEGIEIFHNFRYDPEVDEFEKYIIRADVGFSTKIIYDFDLVGKIEWDYDSKPSIDRKKSDVRYIAGLGYKW